MRRMAAESAAIRSRSASISRPGSLFPVNGSSSRMRYRIRGRLGLSIARAGVPEGAPEGTLSPWPGPDGRLT